VDLRPLLLADDDERRALERALHDGVQQQLVALAVELQTARGLVESDPREALRLIEQMRAELGAALDELRALAQRVHPPLLDTQGLDAALRMAAATAPAATRVEGTVADGIPPETAVTVYRCCVAALAGARDGAAVAVRTRDGAVEFEVELAGGRVDAAALAALAARVEVLGGSLEIDPSGVAGRLPLTPSRPGT